eukprot:3980278-Amphidinium_carterae.2
MNEEQRGFTYYEQQASQGPDTHVDEARAKARLRQTPASSSQASSSRRPGSRSQAAGAASSSHAPPRSSTPAGKGCVLALRIPTAVVEILVTLVCAHTMTHTIACARHRTLSNIAPLRRRPFFCTRKRHAAGSQTDNASSTPSHLFHETQAEPSCPPVAQGASFHPLSELSVLDQCLQIHPDDEVLLADRARLMRQARRLWNLHSTGAIPPLDDQVAFDVTLVLGLETPGTTDAPVFPYVNRQSRKRSIHSRTEEELRNNAKAAEARHRRRHIAPSGHALTVTAEAVPRRRRVLPPKKRRWNQKLRKQASGNRHMPLLDDPIEDFSPVETPGMASTAQLPTPIQVEGVQVSLAEMPINPATTHTVADTLVDASCSSSSSTSTKSGDRHTTKWTEMGEEEPVSSDNSTISASATLCYDRQQQLSHPAGDVTQVSAEAEEQLPSMSCTVPTWQRDRAIVVRSQSDDDDELPLTHLVNGADHLSPLLLASLALLLQAPVTWLTWLPVAMIASPILLTKSAYKCLQHRRRSTFWRVGVSVFTATPKARPKHRFACVRIGEAANPGPARQVSLSFQPTMRDSTPTQAMTPASLPPTAEAVEDSGIPLSSLEPEQLADLDTSRGEAIRQDSLVPSEETPGWDAPRGMHDPAPTRVRPRRTHDVRTAEADTRSAIPASINKIHLKWLDGSNY